MKARMHFYCTNTAVALVLILAAIPSHSTERRDPPMMQDTTQAQGAKSSPSTHPATASRKQPSNSTQNHKAASVSSHQGVPLSDSKDKTAAKRSPAGSGGAHDGAGSNSAAK